MTPINPPLKPLIVGGLALFLGLAGAPALAQEGSSGAGQESGRGAVVMKYDDQVPMGTHRVEDQSGRKYIIYSTGGPSPRSKMLEEAEKEKVDKSWEMLSTIIIDTRSGSGSD